MCVTWVFVANFRSLNTSEMACIYKFVSADVDLISVWGMLSSSV